MTYPRVHLLTANVAQPQALDWDDSRNVHRLIFSCTGSAIAAVERQRSRYLLSSGSALLIPKSASCQVMLGRGNQEWIMATWPSDSSSVALTADRSQITSVAAAFCDPNRNAAIEETTNEVRQGITEGEVHPALSIAWTNLVTVKIVSDGEAFSLADVPDRVSESLATLIEAIKDEPHRSWSLSEAAILAGYSPFHLSRVFRVATDIGFPEFVDRCRTEVAVKELLERERPLAEIAETSGFGSPQAMRGAIREYTGFLPSELRSTASD